MSFLIQQIQESLYFSAKTIPPGNIRQAMFSQVLLMASLFTGDCFNDNIVPGKTATNVHCKHFKQHNELHVDCSHKNLTAVPDAPAATVYLYLQNNLIGQIFNQTFALFYRLVFLDLSVNKISAINENVFTGLQNLRFLYLSRNQIFRLLKNVFKHLVSLTVLDLSYNNINSIHEHALGGLVNLQQLKLSNNGFEEIQNDTFQYTPKLVNLDLFYNSLYSVTKGVFTGLGNLHQLNLGGNFIKNIQTNAFQSLHNLTVLNLLFNSLQLINQQMFAGLPKLRNLNLMTNQLKEISNHTFENLTDLSILDLSNNDLQSINEKTFLGLKNLHVLRLNNNNLGYNTEQLPPGCFQPLESLKQLSVQNNHPLRKVLSTFIFPDETVKDLKMLEMMELDVNSDDERILGIGFSSLHNLSSLIFSGVCNFSLYNDTFEYASNLTNLSIIHCNIMFIETGTFSFLTKLENVQLDFVCYNLLSKPYTLIDIIFSLSKTQIEVLKMNSVLAQEIVPWRDMNVLLFETPIRELHLTNDDHCVGKRSFRKERSIPAPVNLQSLELSDNWIDKIYLNLTFVKFLNLTGNSLGPFLAENSYMLTEISRLEYVCLSRNSIKHLFSKLFVDQPYLRIIDLSLNKLRDVNFDLSYLVNLEILNLSSNDIRFLDDESMKNVDTLLDKSERIKVDFSNNMFQCDCSRVPFLNWMRTSRRHFINFDQYTCMFNQTSSLEFNSFEEGIIVLQTNCLNYFISIIITCSTVFIFIAILVIIAIHRHRQKLRFMFYTLRGRLHFLYYKIKFKNRFRSKTHSENTFDYIYDAFVSYSEEDRTFVLNDCIQHLEKEGNLKLCLHHRDFVPGEDITDNIIHAIESSRKTICIITRSFLQSYYCMFEFNMARMESIHSRNGKNVLFLVFYEQLLPEELPLVLYEVIQKQTYIEFPNDVHGNRIFWEKIKDGISA
ncbi:TLR13 [Mytilus edulis]|uniref:TLR13 n=1 Tax=Mytilus edulis TaxID=6550 RepID=A0A8S3SPL1_MYTED|nr:TLR13 [Mytilus edulis]